MLFVRLSEGFNVILFFSFFSLFYFFWIDLPDLRYFVFLIYVPFIISLMSSSYEVEENTISPPFDGFVVHFPPWWTEQVLLLNILENVVLVPTRRSVGYRSGFVLMEYSI